MDGLKVKMLLSAFFVVCLIFFSPAPGESAMIMQSGIKSWFNSTEKSSQTDSSIRRTRRNAITNAISEVSPTVVCISISKLQKPEDQTYHDYFLEAEEKQALIKTGSGFIISKDGKIVTNAHILKDNWQKIIVSLSSGMSYITEVIGIDWGTNVAVLKIINPENETFKPVQMGESEDLMVGEWTIAMGNPFGLMEEGTPTVNVGVLSAVNRDIIINKDGKKEKHLGILQTDAEIDRMNTGGPLINSTGNVIGLSTYIPTSPAGHDDGLHGVQFAIPINRVKNLVKVLEYKNGIPLNFDPGFEFKYVNSHSGGGVPVEADMGLIVTTVNKDGPAYASGIMPGDIITKIGGDYVQSATHASAILLSYKAGDTLPIVLIRNQQKYKTMMKLRPKMSSD